MISLKVGDKVAYQGRVYTIETLDENMAYLRGHAAQVRGFIWVRANELTKELT